ncbi:hypothetical protein LTR28_013475, partial [Elasticomyces elasticus]
SHGRYTTRACSPAMCWMRTKFCLSNSIWPGKSRTRQRRSRVERTWKVKKRRRLKRGRRLKRRT